MTFREKIINCLGSFPQKVDVKGEIISSDDKGTYIQQLVRYNVEKDEYINAYLLIPKNIKEKNPAILASHQHAGEYYLGKSEPAGLSKNSMYHYGLELCLRGYVVLCPDHLGFEDRRPPEFKRKEQDTLEGGTYEKLLFCRYFLRGSTLQAKYLSDLTRGVDFLETLDFVDRDRIGAIGHSLGGQETLWLMWYDKRIKAAASSCGFGQMKTIMRDNIPHNFAAYPYGLFEIGDISDIVCDIAPRPFLMTNGLKDPLFPIDGVKDIISQAKNKYEQENAQDNFKAIIFDDVHAFPNGIREEVYTWLDQFLMKKFA